MVESPMLGGYPIGGPGGGRANSGGPGWSMWRGAAAGGSEGTRYPTCHSTHLGHVTWRDLRVPKESAWMDWQLPEALQGMMLELSGLRV